MPDVLAWGAALVVASSASAIVVWALSRYRPRWITDHGNTVCVVAVVAGAILGHFVMGLGPQWPPSNALDRFLTIVLPAAVVLQLIGAWRGKSRGWQWAVNVCFALGVGRILLHRSVYLQDNLAESIAILVVSAGLLLVVQSLLTRLWLRTRQASIPLTITAALLTAGLLVLMAGYIKGGTVAFPWAAALTGATLVAGLRANRADLLGVTRLAVVMLFGILFIGRFFGALTTGTAVLVLLMPLLGWVPEWSVFRSYAPWQKECVRLALVAAALFAILLSAKQTFDREMAPLLSEVGERGAVLVETVNDPDEPGCLGCSQLAGMLLYRCGDCWRPRHVSCFRDDAPCL